MGVTEGLTFYPPLIMNGKRLSAAVTAAGISPRSAIGQKKDGTMMFLLLLTAASRGTVSEPLWWMCRILCMKRRDIAANLDGGSSTTLYYNGNVVNKPADLLGERMIPTAFIVK